jgi:hypothetical protein
VNTVAHDFANEAWLVNRLGSFGHVFAGVTDREIRKQRIREAIREGNLEHAIAGGAKRGSPETFADVFKCLYGEDL